MRIYWIDHAWSKPKICSAIVKRETLTLYKIEPSDFSGFSSQIRKKSCISLDEAAKIIIGDMESRIRRAASDLIAAQRRIAAIRKKKS